MKNYEHVTNLSIYIHRSQSWYIWYFQYFIYFCFVAAYFISSFLKWYSTVSPENRHIIFYPLYFQLLVDYFGIFVVFGLSQVIYLSCWQNTKHRSRFSIWFLVSLCCWYHRVWYSAWYYEQFIWVSLKRRFESCWQLTIKNYDLLNQLEQLSWIYKIYFLSQKMVSDFCKTKT